MDTPERKPVIRNERGQIQKGGGSNNPGGGKQWVRDFRKAFSQRCAPMAEEVLAKVLERALDTDMLADGMAKAHANNNLDLVVKFERELSERYKQGAAAAETTLKYTLPPMKQEVELTGKDGEPLMPSERPVDERTQQERMALVLKSLGVLAQHGGVNATGLFGAVGGVAASGGTGAAAGDGEGDTPAQ